MQSFVCRLFKLNMPHPVKKKKKTAVHVIEGTIIQVLPNWSELLL